MYSWTKLKNTLLISIECIVIENILLKNKLLENVSKNTAYIDYFKPYIFSSINIVYHYVQDKKKNVNLSIINDFAGMARH